MNTFYLKAPSKSAMFSDLQSIGLITSDNDVVMSESAVDVIGKILATEAVIDEDGYLISPETYAEGFLFNLYLTDEKLADVESVIGEIIVGTTTMANGSAFLIVDTPIRVLA